MAYESGYSGSLSGLGDIAGLESLFQGTGIDLSKYLNANWSQNGEYGTAGKYTPDLLGLLDSQGYSVSNQFTPGQESVWNLMNGGNVVGSQSIDTSRDGMMKFMSKAVPLGAAAVMAGGAMGGMSGGGGGAMSMGDAIAASGSATTPAAVAGGGMTAGGAMGGGGLLGGLQGGIGSAAGFLGLTPGQMIGGGLGLLSGMDASKDQTQTSMQKMDPRMDAMVYGQGGLLPAAQQWFQQNQQPNPLMMQGAQQQADFYSNPAYAQQFGQLRDTGMGLLSKGIAKNPFMQGN